MAKYKIVMDRAGMTEFMNSEGVINSLQSAAQGVLGRLGDGYAIQAPYHGKTRANVAIETTTKRAYWDNVRNNTMLKALGGKK